MENVIKFMPCYLLVSQKDEVDVSNFEKSNESEVNYFYYTTNQEFVGYALPCVPFF